MKKVVVVLSGGMDSATVLYKVLGQVENPTENVKAISFDYGQRHKKELECAKALCDSVGVEHRVVDLTSIQQCLGGSALTDSIDVPKGHYEDESMKQTVVPNRNSIMANIAIGWAVSLGFDTVALGVHSGDHAIYPDCRPVFIKALAILAEVANYQPIEIYTPYLHSDKEGILADGFKMEVNYGNTHTCYEGVRPPCGECGSCGERIEAFQKLGVRDPLIPEKDWNKL